MVEILKRLGRLEGAVWKPDLSTHRLLWTGGMRNSVTNKWHQTQKDASRSFSLFRISPFVVLVAGSNAEDIVRLPVFISL